MVLGLTYRDGVKELAYSRALPLVERLAFNGATVLAYDPLLTDDEIARTGATAWHWGESRPAVRAIVTPPGRNSMPHGSRGSSSSSTGATRCATWPCRTA